MTRLSVNINKIATLRNARGGNVPDVLKAAVDCQRFGAQGITVHPRPDERHIRYQDVLDLRPLVKTEFNIEGYPSESFIQLVTKVIPEQVTLVPDAHDAVTSNAGWNTVRYQNFLTEAVARFHEKGIRVSVFIDANPEMIRHAAAIGAERIELYTEPYARQFPKNPDDAIKPFVEAALVASGYNLGINAGHDLSLENLEFFNKKITGLLEVSIGHALISDALYFGLENAIMMYRAKLQS
ncbi:MAG: pyridoxine 5'-phosphate synthase [Porphyromonadaceae bacterium]|nr:MAG: pyridoxine 5'-phosphate synthase [Porphyromonadaceae bacterium]